MGVHWKIQVLGRFTKKQYIRGELPKGGRGGGLGQSADLRGGLAKKGWGGVFEEVDTPMHTIVRWGMGDFKKWGYLSNGEMILKLEGWYSFTDYVTFLRLAG